MLCVTTREHGNEKRETRMEVRIAGPAAEPPGVRAAKHVSLSRAHPPECTILKRPVSNDRPFFFSKPRCRITLLVTSRLIRPTGGTYNCKLITYLVSRFSFSRSCVVMHTKLTHGQSR